MQAKNLTHEQAADFNKLAEGKLKRMGGYIDRQTGILKNTE